MADLKRLEAELLPILVKTFPRAFFPSGRGCRPLRVGIFEDLDAVLPANIDRARLKASLGIYTGQPSYLRELKTDAIRIGLNGRAAGRVSPQEASSAAERLQKLDETGLSAAKASPSCPASAPQILPALLMATPNNGAIIPQRMPFRPGLTDTLSRKMGAPTGQPKVVVVVKKRRVPLESQHHNF
jgi:hypothetical protein